VSFVHLHVHSQFSLLDSPASPESIAKQVAAMGMEAVALTDTGNMYGAVAFYEACKREGVRPVLGAVLCVQPQGVRHVDPAGQHGGFHLVALVRNDVGYRNLCKLVTDGIFDGMQYKPRVDFEGLRAHHEGLIFFTGGRRGITGYALSMGKVEAARAWFDEMSTFLGPEDLFLELQDHGLPLQAECNEAIRQLAKDTGYQLLVTNAAHYRCKEDAPVHEALNAIATGHKLSDVKRLVSPTDQAWLKNEEEMRALFPNDEAAIERTVELSRRCEYEFDFSTYHFPATSPPDPGDSPAEQPDTDANWDYFFTAFPPPRDFDLPEHGRPEGAGNINGYFRWYSLEGLRHRLERVDEALYPTYYERLDHEIEIIAGMGFPAYMLIVAEFINWSKDNGIPVGPGRGSAAGSLVAYAMRITDIDPIRYGLLFERFLNPERVSMPDIDVDFCQDRREEAITHVREKYGEDLVAQIITYGKLKAKAAIRDVARITGLNYGEADRIAKLIPDTLGITIAEALEQAPQLRALQQSDPKVKRVLELAQAVEGNCRQTGVHAAGVVIADKPLVNYSPLYRDEPEGGPVVQYDMKSAENIGLIKFDFLGLKTLDQIRDAVSMIGENHGVTVDMAEIPTDDERTYQMLETGDALGVFQLESSGMRELLGRLKPSCIDDMVALVALYRPGPLQTGMVEDFVNRKHGHTAVEYPLPILESLLSSTYGTIIYQEQVMQIAQVMAGYSLGEADLLRRAMGKKKKKDMDLQRTRFVEGSTANGIDQEKADEIFDLLAKFAAYGFNKSHSAAYGYISYQTAYLKAHYRAEYMAALMTIEAGNTDKILLYIDDCVRGGIEVKPVCVNRSSRHFSVPATGDENRVVHFGLAAVKNVGDGAIEAIIEARESEGGRFASVWSFFESIDYKRVNKRVVESLIKAGAMDFGDIPRSAMLAGMEAAMTVAARQQRDSEAGQVGLFSMAAPGARAPSFRFPTMVEWPLRQKLNFEKDVLGLYLSGHPMEGHVKDVARYAHASIREMVAEPDLTQKSIRLLGIVVAERVIRTRRGGKMAFIRLEDKESSIECVFFSEAWGRSQRAVSTGEPILVTGRFEERDGEVKMQASSAEPLSEIRVRSTRQIQLAVRLDEISDKRLKQLKTLFEEHEGNCETHMLVTNADGASGVFHLRKVLLQPTVGLEDAIHALFMRQDVMALI
jgi:DNA polymerase III subunit alpha